MDRLPLAATCAAMLFLVGLGQAADIGGERIADWGLFESIDADRNGWISQQEVQLYGLEHPDAQTPFADIDVDGNGVVSWQEWADYVTDASGGEDHDAGSSAEPMPPDASAPRP